MKVKIVFGSDIRRWHAPKNGEDKYEALVGFIQRTFNFPDVGNFFLQFEDDEGDRMTLSSANDLEDAFTVAEQEDRKSLKIFLIPVSIDEARYDVGARSVRSSSTASLDQFEVLSNPRSNVESSTMSGRSIVDVPELVGAEDDDEDVVEEATEETRSWREELTDFLGNEAVNALLPDFVRGVMQLLRQQESFDVAMLQTLSRVQFEAIDQHPFVEHHLKPHLEIISARATQLIPVLLAFDDDHVAAIVPQLIETACQMLSGMDDCELDVTPIFATLFPTWMAMMNANNPDGATVDLTHIFGCGNAAEAAATMMMNGGEKKDDCYADSVHEGITCDMCNVSPIRGVRYKCCVCGDFDLCQDCESTNTHNKDHPLLKLRQPCRGFSRPRMHGLREMFGRGRCGGWRKFAGAGPHPPFGPPPPFGAAPPFGPPPMGGAGHGPFGGHGRHGHGHGHHHAWGRWAQQQQAQQAAQQQAQQQQAQEQKQGQRQKGKKKAGKAAKSDTASVCSEATVRTDGGRKLKAAFVEDINIPDRSHYQPGLVLEKAWRMKNSGPSEWGEDCSLVFVKGCQAMTLETRYPVPNAQPGDAVQVSAMIRTPDTPARYCAYYRLERDGVKFGPRVWVDIFVTNEEEKVGDAEFSKRELKQMNRQEKLQRKQEKLAAKQMKVKAQLAQLNEEIEAAQQPEGSSLSCMCSAKLVKVDHRRAYSQGARINCDICGRLARQTDDIYHCPNEFSPLHPEGYDLCEACGRDQLRLLAKHNEEVEFGVDPTQPAVEARREDAVATVMNMSMSPPGQVVVPPSAPPAHETNGFPYIDELATVLQMGFGDEEHVKYLLMEYKGNVEAVVQHLLSSMAA